MFQCAPAGGGLKRWASGISPPPCLLIVSRPHTLGGSVAERSCGSSIGAYLRGARVPIAAQFEHWAARNCRCEARRGAPLRNAPLRGVALPSLLLACTILAGTSVAGCYTPTDAACTGKEGM